MEPAESDKEELPDALKMTVSLYDAMYYEDGSPSHWTIEKIKRIEARCSTDAEVQKRVFGRFIVIGDVNMSRLISKGISNRSIQYLLAGSSTLVLISGRRSYCTQIRSLLRCC